MPTPMRLQINTRICSALAAITVANGYNTNIGAVKNRDLVSWEEVRPEDLPVLFPYPGRETAGVEAFGSNPPWFAEMDYLVTGYVYNTVGATRLTETENFIQDVKKAVMADTTLIALVLSFGDFVLETDEGSIENWSWFTCRFRISYQYSQSDGG